MEKVYQHFLTLFLSGLFTCYALTGGKLFMLYWIAKDSENSGLVVKPMRRLFHSLWTGSLFGERLKNSRGEERERVRDCRQTVWDRRSTAPAMYQILMQAPIGVNTDCWQVWFTSLFWSARSTRFDVFWSLTWRLPARDLCAFLAAMNILASEGKWRRPETITAENQYVFHYLSVWNKRQESHFLN